jgi:hypothetical protein
VVHFNAQNTKQLFQPWQIGNRDSNVIESDHK